MSTSFKNVAVTKSRHSILHDDLMGSQTKWQKALEVNGSQGSVNHGLLFNYCVFVFSLCIIKIKVMAGVDAASDGYRRVASHRPQRGGHVSYLCLQYFILTGLVVLDVVTMILQ